MRIREARICRTDYSLYSGRLSAKLPIISGHEAAGEVAAVGPEVLGLNPGERVTIQPNFSCGKCSPCLTGKENICPNKVRLGLDTNGVFAQYVAVPQKYVWPLPEEISFSVGALVEPPSVALHGFNKRSPSPHERILVYGAGAIGLLFARLAVLAEGDVAAFDIAEPRLRAALKLGARKIFRSLV